MHQERKSRIARIRLADGAVDIWEVDPEVQHRFLGGRGLGLWMMQNLTDDPEPMILITGPLTDSGVSSGGRYCAVTRSVFSGMPISPSSGSAWGIALRQSGWDGIVLEGEAPAWSYLAIDGSSVQLHDAAEYQGRQSGETDRMLKARHGVDCSVLSIGPAGENGVALSAILCDGQRAFARGGIGAIMGEKKLKALVVRGEGSLPANACTRCPIHCGHADKETDSAFGRLCNEYGLDAIGTSRAIAVAAELGNRGIRDVPTFAPEDWISFISRQEAPFARLVGMGAEALCKHYHVPELLYPAGKTARSGLKHCLTPELAAVIDSLGGCIFTAARFQTEDYARLLSAAVHRDYSEEDIVRTGRAICELECSLAGRSHSHG